MNFCQVELTAQLYVDVDDRGSELGSNEAYFLLPCPDNACVQCACRLRHLTASEYRMSRMTAIKLGMFLRSAGHILDQVHEEVLGEHLISEELHD